MTEEHNLDCRIDRLVCGDLSHDDRTELIEWLEAEPIRWRAGPRAAR